MPYQPKLLPDCGKRRKAAAPVLLADIVERAHCYINPAAHLTDKAGDFSHLIREGVPGI